MSLRLVGMTMLYFFSNESSKTIRTRRSLENVLFSESSSILVSRKRNKQIDMRCCLNVVSSSNDYENRTFGLRDRTFLRICSKRGRDFSTTLEMTRWGRDDKWKEIPRRCSG